MSDQTVRSGEAGTYRVNRPNKNYKDVEVLRARTGVWGSWLRMKSPAKAKTSVWIAELVLTQVGATTGNNTIQVQQMAEDSSEKELTYNTRPTTPVGAAVPLTKGASPNGTEWRFQVQVNYQAIANGTANHGFVITQTAGTDVVAFGNIKGPKVGPYLRVVWSNGPQQPTILKPANSVVSLDKWFQSCDYVDRQGDNTIKSVNVQIDPTADWTGGDLFDSGWKDVDGPGLDLATTAYGGLADNAVTTLRMRTMDATGQPSPWSDAVTVTRKSKGVLTITAPGAPSSNYVEEFTPPIQWTFVGRTQTHYRVQIVNVAHPRKVLADSGRVKSAATTWTVPKQVLNSEDTFRVIVWVWDDQLREGITGDPAYVEATRDFTVVPSAVPAVPTAVTAEPIGNTPAVEILVSAATSPDSWSLDRKEVGRAGTAVAVLSDVEPTDVFVSAGLWRLVDQTARAGVQYRYTPRREVNGKLSAAGPTADSTVLPQGIWLWDPSDDVETQFVVLGGREFSGNMTDNAETYYGQGGLDVIRAVMGQNGLAGECQNLLLRSRNGRTWRDFEEQLYAYKDKPDETYRLALGSTNIPVILGDITIDNHPETRPDQVLMVVSFKFWQDGEHQFGKAS